MPVSTKRQKRRAPDQRKAITPPELALEWSRDPNTILDLIRSGELEAFNTARPGKRPRYLITREAIASFIARRSAVPAPKAARSRRTAVESATRYF